MLSKEAATRGARTNLGEPSAVAEVTAPVARPTSRAQHNASERLKSSSPFSILSGRMPWLRSASRATTDTGATQSPLSAYGRLIRSCVRKVDVPLYIGGRFKLEPEPEVHSGVADTWIIARRLHLHDVVPTHNVRIGVYRAVDALYLRGLARPSRPRALWCRRIQELLDIVFGLFCGTIRRDGTRPFVLQPLAFLGSRVALKLVASERENLEIVFRGQVWVPYACLLSVYGSC